MKIVERYAIGHPATEGHFPGRPIIPGVVILRDVLRAVRNHAVELGLSNAGNVDGAYHLRAAKFLRPIVPGEDMVIALRVVHIEATASVHFDCMVNGEAAAKGSLEFHV
jgi:3-hydroxymyristoyl/3-hydroxydecanoyl-(acyl carrier protein) dehydratase